MKKITKRYQIGDFTVSEIRHNESWWKVTGSYSDPGGMFRSDKGKFEFMFFSVNPADELAELLEKKIPSYFESDKFDWQKDSRDMFREIFLIEDSLKYFSETDFNFDEEMKNESWVNERPSAYLPAGHKGVWRRDNS